MLDENANYGLDRNQYSVISLNMLLRGTEQAKETSELADQIYKYLDFTHNVNLTDYYVTSILAKQPIYALTDNNLIHYTIDCQVTISKK